MSVCFDWLWREVVGAGKRGWLGFWVLIGGGSGGGRGRRRGGAVEGGGGGGRGGSVEDVIPVGDGLANGFPRGMAVCLIRLQS